jgi:hypothetical protein
MVSWLGKKNILFVVVLSGYSTLNQLYQLGWLTLLYLLSVTLKKSKIIFTFLSFLIKMSLKSEADIWGTSTVSFVSSIKASDIHATDMGGARVDETDRQTDKCIEKASARSARSA